MSEELLWGLVIIGLLIIFFLIWFIKNQFKRLQQLRNEQQQLQQKAKDKRKALQLDVKESIRVIATVMLDDQVELSEGCLRLKVLIDNLDPLLHELEELKIITHMSEQLAHMPTHDARKAVDKKFIRKLDEQRFKLEAKHRDAIRHAAETLIKKLDASLKAVE